MTSIGTQPKIVTALVALGAWMVVMSVVATGATAAAGDGGEFLFKDKFNSGNYNGNAGSHDFWGPWFEYKDWGGAGKGAVSVESGGGCPNERCARIMGDDAELAGEGLARWADLTDAAAAKIKFKYAQRVDEGDGGVKVVVNDGNDWRTVYEIVFDERDDNIHTKTISVTQYANTDFAIGFFAYGALAGEVYIDDVEIFGVWDATTTTTSTTVPPSTTTTTTTTTAPPTTTTTTTTKPPTVTTTTVPPTTTTRPPKVTTTTAPPPVPPTTSPPVATQPPTTAAPTTTLPPATLPPFENDQRYVQKAELASHLVLVESMMEMPTAIDQIPAPSPVTQIVASLTTTAVTIRSHLLPAVALGLMIAVAALWGLGRRDAPINAVRRPSSRSRDAS